MERIGIAFTKRTGTTNRRREYGIYAEPAFPETRYTKYEGYREDSPTGEVMVGLALAGPHSCYTQPLTPFLPTDFETTRFFKENVCS